MSARTIRLRLTFVTKHSIEIMFVSNSDSEVPEVGEDDLELQGSFCTSDEATDEHYLHEAYADEPLADALWFDAV